MCVFYIYNINIYIHSQYLVWYQICGWHWKPWLWYRYCIILLWSVILFITGDQQRTWHKISGINMLYVVWEYNIYIYIYINSRTTMAISSSTMIIRRPLQGGGRQRSRDIANLGGSLWLTGLTFCLIFPILMHSLGDVWHPGSGVPCFGGFGGFRSLWGLTVSLSSLSSYLNAFLRWRLAFVKTWYQEILHNNLFRIHPHAPKAPGRGSFAASFSAQVFGSTLKVDEFGLSGLFCRSLALLGFGKGQSYRIRNVTSHLNTWEAGRE